MIDKKEKGVGKDRFVATTRIMCPMTRSHRKYIDKYALTTYNYFSPFVLSNCALSGVILIDNRPFNFI